MNAINIEGLTGNIIGCAMKVHTKLGFGFVESVYENSLAHEIRRSGYIVQQQVPIKVFYDDIVVGEFVADIVVNGEIIVELKAVEALNKIHQVQLANYLTATGKDIGLLLNFGARSLEFKRKYRLPKSNLGKPGFTWMLGFLAVLAGKFLGHF